jgi:hypothetical protein
MPVTLKISVQQEVLKLFKIMLSVELWLIPLWMGDMSNQFSMEVSRTKKAKGVSSSQAKSMVQHNEQFGSEQLQYYQKHKSFNNIIWWPTSKICTCMLLFYNWKLDLNWSYISFSADHISLLHHHYGICSASDLGRIRDTSKKNSFQRILVTHHGATSRERCSSIGGVQAKNQGPSILSFTPKNLPS